jgi:cytochrome c oxidase subunit 2
MEGIMNFHHDLFFFLVVIAIFTFYFLYNSLVRYNSKTNKEAIVVTHAVTLEVI